MQGWNGLRGEIDGGMGTMDGRMEWMNGWNRKRDRIERKNCYSYDKGREWKQ